MEENQSSPTPKTLRVTGTQRGERIRFFFDGRPIDAHRGESVATALHAAGILTLRRSPRDHEPRGSFCWMGLCQECVVVADGVRRPACRLEVEHGMVVASGTAA